jgi:predicted transcriptional regulator
MIKVPERNRSRLQIIAEILRKLREPTGKTNIMSRCNMSSIQSGEYLSFMRSNDLIRMDAIAGGRVTYQRTATGREFLEAYNKMVLLLEPTISAPSLIWQ